MIIAFVGIKKDWKKLKDENYTMEFLKYHLELPWYFAEYGKNNVVVVPENEIYEDNLYSESFKNGGSIELITQEKYKDVKPDVVIHWRKWFEQFYKNSSINVINSQDHSYSIEWMTTVKVNAESGKLYGITCFPDWHLGKIQSELISRNKFTSRLRWLPGVTLGVDTQIYRPSEKKNRYDLLWASDPGRGLEQTLKMFFELYRRDSRYKLHVCWPDYANAACAIQHPGIVYHTNLKNGPELWNLFNDSMFLPYATTFMEPSSRAHRQAMAAGCIVLYPPNMGTPSELISHCVNGYVCNPDTWCDIILNTSDDEFSKISNSARLLSLNENWNVQSDRFNKLFKKIINEEV